MDFFIFKRVCASSKYFFVFFSLLFSFHSAQSDPYFFYSPVGLQENTVHQKKIDQFNKKFDGLMGLVYLSYQRLAQYLPQIPSQRPWDKDAFVNEYAKHFTRVKSSSCPLLKEFCKIKKNDFFRLGRDEMVTEVIRTLEKDFSRKTAKEKLGVEKVTYYTQKSIPFNYLFSAEIQKESFISQISYKNRVVPPTDLIIHHKTILDDIGTHHQDIVGKRYFSFIGISESGVPIINATKAKRHAVYFGNRWKDNISSQKRAKGQRLPTSFDIAFDRMFDSLSQKLANVTLKLEKRLLKREKVEKNKFVLERIIDAKKRFSRAKKNRDFPRESYHFVAFDLFMNLLKHQATYLSLVDISSNDKRTKSISAWNARMREGLLALFKVVDPSFLLALIDMEGTLSRGFLLNQYFPPKMINGLRWEILSSIFGFGKYKSSPFYEEFPDTFDEVGQNFVDGHFSKIAPELIDLKKQGIQFDQLEARYKKALLLRFLFSPEGQPRQGAIFRLFGGVIQNLAEKEILSLSDFILEKNRENFDKADSSTSYGQRGFNINMNSNSR